VGGARAASAPAAHACRAAAPSGLSRRSTARDPAVQSRLRTGQLQQPNRRPDCRVRRAACGHRRQ
jgi:hypothetical protein